MSDYVIKTPKGYVAGIDSQHLACVHTSQPNDFAKRFKTEAAAEKWLKKYADAGYGLSSDTAKIVKL